MQNAALWALLVMLQKGIILRMKATNLTSKVIHPVYLLSHMLFKAAGCIIEKENTTGFFSMVKFMHLFIFWGQVLNWRSNLSQTWINLSANTNWEINRAWGWNGLCTQFCQCRRLILHVFCWINFFFFFQLGDLGQQGYGFNHPTGFLFHEICNCSP